MSYCGPSFAVPSCASSPVVGFGSPGLSYGGSGFGCGAPAFAVPSMASSPVVGFGSAGLGYSSGVPSSSLGVLSGVNPSCINQIPPSEVVVQPPPIVVTLPGPILSATGEPVRVGGNTPCAVSYGRSVIAGGGGALGGRLGSRRGSLICGRRCSLSPC
uniref:feather keratin 4-like n=1 Tax=Euleptes europaea TaxID=460621 RepID=UPI0025409ADE|nr:feather keratin 4-like [Euleptes europaea]